MNFVVRRAALCAAAAAAAKLTTKDRMHSSLSEHLKLQLQFENGLLRLHAGDGFTTFDAWLPAAFNDINGSICTSTKEFVHLLRNETFADLLAISGDSTVSHVANVGGHTLGGHVPYSEFPCEYPVWNAEKLTIPVTDEVIAAVQLALLRRVTAVIADFSENTRSYNCYDTMLIEPSNQGLRFCATNGTVLVVIDARYGVLGCRADAAAQAFSAVTLLRAALSLWYDVDDLNAVDCEVQVSRRTVQHPDGEIVEIDPFVVFDIAGNGYRARISTRPQGVFPQYRNVIGEYGDSGLLFEPRAKELLEVAQLAEDTKLKRDHGRMGFHCSFANPNNVLVQVLHAHKVDLMQDTLIVQRTAVEYPGVLLGALAQPRRPAGSAPTVPPVSEIVSFNSGYVQRILQYLQDRHITVKLKGAAAAAEIATTDDGPDQLFFVLMPFYGDILEENL